MGLTRRKTGPTAADRAAGSQFDRRRHHAI